MIRIAFMILVAACTICCGSPGNSEVKKCGLAGQWYPAGPKELAALIDSFLGAVPAREGTPPLMLVVPHAGYAYSGAVAAQGYALLKKSAPDYMVIIAPSHYGGFRGCSTLALDFYETPLGRVRIDRATAAGLIGNGVFSDEREAHGPEHALEIQLPFLQRALGKKIDALQVLPVLVGDLRPGDAGKAASALAARLAGRKAPLVIISTDFTHYGERFGFSPFGDLRVKGAVGRLRELDQGAIDLFIKHDAPALSRYFEQTGITVCGRNAMLLALSLPVKGYNAGLIAWTTSGDVTGDWSSTVSYACIAVHGTLEVPTGTGAYHGPAIGDHEKKFLLGLARGNIRSHIEKGKEMSVSEPSVPASCREITGVFVTLRKHGELRGCIGYPVPEKPLYRGVLDNSYNAAFEDPRFPPLGKGELDAVTIEISVLTPPREVPSFEDVVVGRDGLIIEKGRRRGLLLPQVPVEWGWSRDEFLTHTCRKAGLPDDAWRSGARLFTFQSLVFSEEER